MKPVENTLAVSIFVVLTKRKGCRLVKFSWRLSNLWRLCLRYLLRCLSLQRNFNCTISHANISIGCVKFHVSKHFYSFEEALYFLFCSKNVDAKLKACFCFTQTEFEALLGAFILNVALDKGKIFFLVFFYKHLEDLICLKAPFLLSIQQKVRR